MWNELAQSAWVPIWIMLLWAISLSSWLAIFWTKLIKTVWNDITQIDQIKAFCIALSAATTVLLASTLWLPVSSTQITIWAIFWIWLFRLYLSVKKWKPKETINFWMMKWIILSWLVTLPVSWLISALTYIIIMKF
jgi:phosphate/sulfate permease